MLEPNMKIYQGVYSQLGSPEEIAEAWKGYDVVVLTHVWNLNKPNGCLDGRYLGITELVTKLRVKNDRQLIYGYVPVTADAPEGSGCGYIVPYAEQPWEPPNGIATEYIAWCKEWVKEGVDGIFIDLFSPHFASPAMRDNALSYVRFLGLLAMVNVTHPSMENVRWACSSQHFARGDYVLIEGFLLQDGKDTEAESMEALSEFEYWRDWKGFRLAALVTTEAKKPVQPIQRRNLLHRMEGLVQPGDFLALDSSNLGT